MALDLSALDAALKTFYGPELIKMINNKTKTLDLFTKNSDASLRVDGRNVVYPIHVGRNPAVGAVGENKTLPVAQNQVTTSVTVPFKYNYGRIQLSTQAIKQSMTSKGAFIKAMELETKNVVLDLARDRNRQLYGNGVGTLCLVSGSNAAGLTINIKSPGGVTYPGGVSTGAGRLLLPNQWVAFVRSATPTSASDSDIVATATVRQITATGISSDGTSVTFSATTGATLNDGDLIINAPGATATECAVNRECMGLLGLVDDGTYLTTLFGVSRTTYPQYKSTVIGVNGNLSLDVIQRGIDLQDEKGGDLSNTVFLCHHSVRREYLNLLQAPRRYTGDQVNSPDGGFKGGAIGNDSKGEITYAEQPWKVERMAPLGMLFNVDKSFLSRYIVTEGEWADEDGAILNRILNVDAYEARYRVFDNFASDRPDTCVRWDGIASTYDYTPVE